MILYDTPGVIEKKMHKLDSMMMKNVRNAAVNANCVLVLVDACKMPQKVCFLFGGFDLKDSLLVLICCYCYDFLCRLMKYWRKGLAI